MKDLSIVRINDVYVQILCDESIAWELNDYFSFFMPGYKFSKKFRNKLWDGKIHLFNIANNYLYAGLIYEVIRFVIDRNYSIEIDDEIELLPKESITVDTGEFIRSLNLPFEPYNYQKNAVDIIATHKRALILSPTSSGKSLIIYAAIRYLVEELNESKVLIVVPSTSLVEQMYSDFDDYARNTGWTSSQYVHRIYDYDGVEHETDKPIVVTTWQSVYKKNKKWFSQFRAVFIDEAHEARGDSIQSIARKLTNCPYRIGLTGTIEDTKTHKFILQGILGRIFKTISTREMMDRKIASDLLIKGVILNYPDADRKKVSSMRYKEEIDWLVSNERRNRFITNLALSTKENTLVLFNYVERHGKPLFELMNRLNKQGKKIFFVHGEVDTQERESIRKYAEKHDNVIILASYGTYSRGINIKNLGNVIFAHPFKGKIRNLQSIGRTLRKATNLDEAVLYDIADDLSWKSKKNTAMKHFAIRLNIYDRECFLYKLIKVDI